MHQLSDSTRKQILALLDKGQSSHRIARQLDVGRATVDRVRRVLRPGAQKSRGGRPAKLSQVDRRAIIRAITSGKHDTASQAAREFNASSNVTVTPQTVRRALKDAGLKAGPKAKKPKLRPHHVEQRLQFALKHQDWTVEDWKRVIWSDETKVNRLCSDGRKWIWKIPGDRVTARTVQGTLKFGGGSLMIWGCITAMGPGYMCRIDGRMNADLYVDILEDELLETINYYSLDQQRIIFQQDNDPKHNAHKTLEWLSEIGIKVLDWPPQSPDLNPIEHVWFHLKQQLAKYEREPTGMIELWERVESEWNKITPEICLHLIETMPQRIASVLKAKGGYTKY